MPTAERYFQVFVQTMPKRGEIIRRKIQEKWKLDSKLKSNEPKKPFTDRDLKDLIALIGDHETHFFNKDIIYTDQSLRYFVWKYYQSLLFYHENRVKILDNLASMESKYQQLIRAIDAIVEKDLELLAQLLKIYESQIAHLKQKNIPAYLDEDKLEDRVWEDIIDHNKTLSQYNFSLVRMIQDIVKAPHQDFKTGKEKTGGLGVVAGVADVFIVLGVATMLLSLKNPDFKYFLSELSVVEKTGIALIVRAGITLPMMKGYFKQFV